jgi:type I restriction enzyme S subunit
VDLSEAKYVTTADAEKFRNRCNPEQDDVLVVSRGATIGRISVVQTDCAFCLMGSVILIKPAEGTHKKYLAFALKSPDCQSQLVDLCGHSAQQAIYIRDIRKLSIKVPPLPEQKEIVRRVNALFALADQIDTKLTRAKARVDKLTQAILAKAFRGELVPTEAELARREGRQYESAEKLLERIQANSAASNGQPLRINSERKQKKNREPKGQPK